MNKFAVIFDMDGVIFDSESMYMQELIDFYDQYGITVSLQECKKLIGVDSRKFNDIAYSWWQGRSDLNTFIKMLDSYYEQIKRDYSKILNPNILPLLKYLKEHQYQIALASSSSPKLISQALNDAKITQYFDLITSGNQFQESKPNPQIYLYTLAKLKITNQEAVVIEDSSYGIEAALRAEITVLALKDNQFALDQSQADMIINDLLEVIDYLENKNNI